MSQEDITTMQVRVATRDRVKYVKSILKTRSYDLTVNAILDALEYPTWEELENLAKTRQPQTAEAA